MSTAPISDNQQRGECFAKVRVKEEVEKEFVGVGKLLGQLQVAVNAPQNGDRCQHADVGADDVRRKVSGGREQRQEETDRCGVRNSADRLMGVRHHRPVWEQ